MPSNSDSTLPRTLEDLVPYVSDVIEHAITLQSQAEASARRVEAAATAVLAAVKELKSTQAQMAADIEGAVARKFDTAIDGASTRIGQHLTSAEGKAREALQRLTTATTTAAQTIQNEADQLGARQWWPALIGSMGGLLIGGMGVYLWIHHVAG